MADDPQEALRRLRDGYGRDYVFKRDLPKRRGRPPTRLTPEQRKANEKAWRRQRAQKQAPCEATGCPRSTARKYCDYHRVLNELHGHPSVARMVTMSDLEPILKPVRRYLLKHPIAPSIIEKLEREVTGPFAQYLINYRDLWNPTRLERARRVLQTRMRYWREHPHRWPPRTQTPFNILSALVACVVHFEEQDIRAGQADHVALAMILMGFGKSPMRMVLSQRRGTALRRPVPISGTLRRLLGQTISEKLATFLLPTARAFLKWDGYKPVKKRGENAAARFKKVIPPTPIRPTASTTEITAKSGAVPPTTTPPTLYERILARKRIH